MRFLKGFKLHLHRRDPPAAENQVHSLHTKSIGRNNSKNLRLMISEFYQNLSKIPVLDQRTNTNVRTTAFIEFLHIYLRTFENMGPINHRSGPRPLLYEIQIILW